MCGWEKEKKAESCVVLCFFLFFVVLAGGRHVNIVGEKSSVGANVRRGPPKAKKKKIKNKKNSRCGYPGGRVTMEKHRRYRSV